MRLNGKNLSFSKPNAQHKPECLIFFEQVFKSRLRLKGYKIFLQPNYLSENLHLWCFFIYFSLFKCLYSGLKQVKMFHSMWNQLLMEWLTTSRRSLSQGSLDITVLTQVCRSVQNSDYSAFLSYFIRDWITFYIDVSFRGLSPHSMVYTLGWAKEIHHSGEIYYWWSVKIFLSSRGSSYVGSLLLLSNYIFSIYLNAYHNSAYIQHRYSGLSKPSWASQGFG